MTGEGQGRPGDARAEDARATRALGAGVLAGAGGHVAEDDGRSRVDAPLGVTRRDDGSDDPTALLVRGEHGEREEDATRLVVRGESVGEEDPTALVRVETDAPRRLQGSRVGATRAGTGRLGEATRVSGPLRFSDATRIRSTAGFVDDDGEVFEPAPLDVQAGGKVGRFVVLRELGRGAMGVVFAAYDEELDRKVAIKLLHASHTEDASYGRAMLLREAQAMARLAHPNVVAVHEVGVIAGAVFVAMEYVAGVDLHRWLTMQRRPWREALATMREAGAGLVAAHKQGLVHRDFKPSNVLVGDDGRVRVADFGLAARRGGESSGAAGGEVRALDATLTGEGALIGTPLYMAPELLRGAAATARSDQYAYCVALYEALYGHRPFDADTLSALTTVVERRGLPGAPLRSDVPAWLHAAVCRGLAKSPEDRWPSLAELVDLLARDPEAERRQRRRIALQIAGAIAATAVIVALLVIGYGAARRYADERQAERRLAALREQVAALADRGEASRLIDTFVRLPENRGSPVIARAYLEWAALQSDPAAAVDAYASAYIAARTPADGHAALRGLIDRLRARGQIAEAAAALAVLERAAPDEATDPALQDVRLAAALARRDLAAACAVLGAGDADGWSPVLEDMSHVTELPRGLLGMDVERETDERQLEVLDLEGDGREELVRYDGEGTLHVHRADVSLTPLRKIAVGPARRVRAVAPVVAGEPLILASYPASAAGQFELRLFGESGVDIERWADSVAYHPLSHDFGGDGRRELYIATEAYARRFWRVDRADDGAWTRRVAHRPTDTVGSDLMGVVAADFEGDGRAELVVTAGPWRAYDVRVYRPTEAGELDQVARRAFGSFRLALTKLRQGDRDVVAFIKSDAQISPGRFPADKPLGEPEGLYVVGLDERGQIEVRGHMPVEPVDEPRLKVSRVLAGDLDGDGHDELLFAHEPEGLTLLRVRAGATGSTAELRPRTIAGLVPVLVADLDADGEAEVIATVPGEPGRLLLLGAGEARLEPRAVDELAPRAVPPGIADPVIAEAWARAEQLVAIGLPRRTAGELAAIARLAGHVAPDMLLRTAELYAQVGEDALAAEHFVAAATRGDVMSAALAGAAAARRRLGEFAEAAALTRRRLDVVGDDERGAAAAELASLEAATAARPELALTFERPLDARWRIHDPVAVRRGLERGVLSVWTSPTPVAAEFPLVWDGGPASLAVELEIGELEWGTEIAVEVTGQGDRPWLIVKVGGFGLAEAPQRRVVVTDVRDEPVDFVGSRVRGELSVYPAFDTVIRALETSGPVDRKVGRMNLAAPGVVPPPGPLRLRVTTRSISRSYVAHVALRSIRLTGFTAGEPAEPADAAARLLAEGQYADVVAALIKSSPGSVHALWRLEALLALGRIEPATRAMGAVLAAAGQGPLYDALYQRVRRPDPIARLVARAAFGPRLIDVLFDKARVHAGDVEEVLVSLRPTSPSEAPGDPEAQLRLVLVDLALGMAHEHAGQLAAAQPALAAAFERVSAIPASPSRDALRTRLIEMQLDLAVERADREAALRWVRARVVDSETPYLVLEHMQSDRALFGLIGADAYAALLAEVRVSRP